MWQGIEIVTINKRYLTSHVSKIFLDQLGNAPAAVSDTLPSVSAKEKPEAEDVTDEDLSEMQQRLEALRS